MSEEIKNTAITAAGYVYQNRQGLKLLCDWLDVPTRYPNPASGTPTLGNRT